jgi:hypothetical protein
MEKLKLSNFKIREKILFNFKTSRLKLKIIIFNFRLIFTIIIQFIFNIKFIYFQHNFSRYQFTHFFTPTN